MKSLIIIPARYGSTRLPGKPLKEIAGQTMLSRVVDIARAGTQTHENVEIVVATDDERIIAHCEEINVRAVMTPVECPSGTDRALAAVTALQAKGYEGDPDFVLNLQGDAPMTPPDFIGAMLDAFKAEPHSDVLTPVTQMTWQQLDDLREAKKETPYSGTTAILDKEGFAIWFSKHIIPAVRKEEKWREKLEKSPVYRHIGIYGYRYEKLKEYVTLNATLYEELEGLEQLRALENGFKMKCVIVDYKGRPSMSGVDSPIDIERAEALIAKHGEIVQ